jgi:hypothetical protein
MAADDKGSTATTWSDARAATDAEFGIIAEARHA